MDSKPLNAPAEPPASLNNGSAVDANGEKNEDAFSDLLEKVRLGDSQAIESLVNRYERPILRIVRNRLGRQMRSVLDSMDIVQSVHRSLLIGLRRQRFQFQSSEQLIALAALMVQRKVSRHWSRLKSSIERTVSCAPIGESDGGGIDQVPASSPSPSMEMVRQELLSACLAKLDELDQQLVNMKLAGQSTTETAEKLGRDPAFIRMRWSRLRRTLRESGCLEALG